MENAIPDAPLDISDGLGVAPEPRDPLPMPVAAAALGLPNPILATLPASFTPVVPGPRIGTAPHGRAPLARIPGADLARLGEPQDFTDGEMYKILLAKGLDLLDTAPPKVQAAVWHDLMEVQGLLGKRPSEGDSSPAGSPTLNALIMGDKTAAPLMDAIKQMTSGMQVRSGGRSSDRSVSAEDSL